MRARLASLLALLVLSAVGCSAGEQAAAPPPETVTVTVSEPAPPPAAEDEYREEDNSNVTATGETEETFEGAYFSVTYPDGWWVETAEVSKGSYLDTTIRDAEQPEIMLRIDVSPGSYADPGDVAAEVEGYLVDQPRYRRLGFEPTTFLGYDAMRWDFVVSQDGRLLRKSDIFFTTEEGDGVAILIQAPAERYLQTLTELEMARNSLLVGGQTAELSEQYEPDAASGEDFCATHACIDNFENGSGYRVQCADGMWSQSGGRPGACSYHGGVAGGRGGSSYGGSGYDDNGDGSTYNWCGASRDGDGDGRWCEGR